MWTKSSQPDNVGPHRRQRDAHAKAYSPSWVLCRTGRACACPPTHTRVCTPHTHTHTTHTHTHTTHTRTHARARHGAILHVRSFTTRKTLRILCGRARLVVTRANNDNVAMKDEMKDATPRFKGSKGPYGSNVYLATNGNKGNRKNVSDQSYPSPYTLCDVYDSSGRKDILISCSGVRTMRRWPSGRHG